MYLRVGETWGQATHDPATAGWELRSLSTRSGLRVTLHTAPPGERADAVADQSLFHLSQDRAGRSGAQQPSYAHVAWMDGKGAVAEVRAALFGGPSRIWPLISDIPGVVRILVGEATDHSMIAMVLTTDTRAIDHTVRTIKMSRLLPGQDPALLTAPDRDGNYAVSPLRSPTAVPRAASGAERLAMTRAGMTCAPRFLPYPCASGRWAG